MVSAFSRWKRYDETRQALAKVTKSLFFSHTHNKIISIFVGFIILREDVWMNEAVVFVFCGGLTGTVGDDNVS